VTTRRSSASWGRTSVEAALRHLGARRYDDLVELVENTIRWPDGPSGTILAPLIEATSVMEGWTPADRARALWRVIEEGINHPQVSPTAHPRHRPVLQAAFRLPDKGIEEEWRASLTERFKQLGALPVFSNATSTQPMEIAWKRGVERLAGHLRERLGELRTPEDWAHYKPIRLERPDLGDEQTIFRAPSGGAQKLVVNLFIMTVLMQGRGEHRRISERWITSQDEEGLRYFRTWAFSSGSHLQGRTYTPTRALWGCRAEQVAEDGMPVTRLWFPQPLRTGERAHFMAEAVHENPADDVRGWTNVEIDHHGIEPGELHDGVLPLRGLTIRIKFDALPNAVWWYAEQNELERYRQPPDGDPCRLPIVCGEVVKTFENPCQPREAYGIAYTWD
jgi:hypothetical protein